MVNRGSPISSARGISGSVHASRAGSSGSERSSTSSSKWEGWTLLGEPVRKTPSAIARSASISTGSAFGTTSAGQPDRVDVLLPRDVVRVLAEHAVAGGHEHERASGRGNVGDGNVLFGHGR